MRYALLFLRLVAGWYFLYAGFTKVVNSTWSAAGYIGNAKTFPAFFTWLATPQNIGWVNFLNEWGLVLVGVALILGIFTRYAALAGALMLFFYYLPILDFPYAGAHGYIIDDHIFAIAALFVLALSNSGRFWGVDSYLRKALQLPRWIRQFT